MAIGTDIMTWFEGTWHKGDVPIMHAADHGAWQGTNVFDGARMFDGLTPDLDKHCARVNRSAEAMMVTPTMDAAEMVGIVHEGLAAMPQHQAV
jgi:branched-chain amino acid aminotransferase